MAKFTEQMLDDIRGRLQVSAVIGQYVKLRKSGTEFRGVDDESLTVNDRKQLWWDHAKSEGGDIFKFLTERQGFQFPDAVERLASQAGVSMPANAGRSNGAAHRDRNDRPNGAVPRGGDPRDQESGDPGHAAQDHPSNPGGTDASARAADAASSRRNVTCTYDYTNGDGLLIYQTCRVEWEDRGKKKKTFMQRRPDPKGEPNVWVWGLGAGEFMRRGPGKDWYRYDDEKWDAWKCTERMAIVEAVHHTLYRLPDLREAIADERVIWNCEGEKDVETFVAWDMAATTNSGGAQHWTDYHAELLRDADVVIPIDNDQAGRERGQKVARSLRGIAKRIRVLDIAKHWPEARTKDDITDWRDRGGLTSDALYEILDKLPDWTPEPYRSKFGAIRWRDLHTSSSISYEWAIKGIVPLGENVLIYGETQTGKSFKTFDMAAAIARGVEYLGRRVRQGLVIYCAAEAGHGFPLRMTAYERHHNLQGGSDFPFVLLTRRIDIFATEQEVDELILEIQAIAEEYAMPVSAVVIDTYNAATPGAKENASEDVSLIIKRLDKIRSASRAGIWLVHHKNAAGDKPRGHTSLLANFETAIEIAPKLDLHVKPPRPVLDDDGRQIRVATVKKQREGEAGFIWEFVLPGVQIATDEDGDPVTSCVVAPPKSRTAAQETDARAVAKKRKSMGWRLSRNEDFFFRAMLAALDAHGQPPPAALRLPGSVGRVVDYEHVKAEFKKRMLHEEADQKKEADRIKTALRRSREELAQQNLLATDNPWVWPTGRRVMFRDNTFWPPLSSAEQAQARGEPPLAEPRDGELSDADLEDLLKPSGGRY